MRQLLLSLLVATAASAQPLLLGPEQPLPVRTGIASAAQQIQGAPSDGTNRLIVWLDTRNYYSGYADFSDSGMLVLAARVDAQGHVLDIPNLVLPMRAHGPVLPFWNGHEFVVVTAREYTRVSAAGEILGHGTFVYPPLYADSIAWSGDRLMIVTQEMNDIHAVVYDASFNVVRDDFVLIDHTLPRRTVAASNGDGFMVVGQEFNPVNLTAVLVDRNGAVSHSLTIHNTFGLETPMLASDGEKYLLAALTSPSFTDMHFVSYAVTSDGLVFPREFSFGTVDNFALGPQLEWQGDQYALAYSRRSGISIIHLDRNALVRGEETLLDHVPIAMRISSGAAPHIFFWSDNSLWTDRGQLYTDVPTFAQSSAQRFVLGQGSMAQETPASATAGDISLLIWRERNPDGGPLRLYAARADRFGRQLDAQPLRISDVTCDVFEPAVATNGRDFLVAWQEGHSIRAIRVGRDGRLLDPAAIVVSSDETDECRVLGPKIATNGSVYLVAWGSPRTAVTFDAAVKAKRISFDGALLDAAPLPLATSFASNLLLTDFHIASDGHEFMVGWTVGTYALVMRLTGEGTPREFGGITLAMPSVRALFWNGTNYVALSYAQYERITPGGQRIDVTPSGKAPSITLPAALTRPGTRGFSVPCDASGCYLYSWSDGTLTGMRFDDTASGVVPVTTLTQVGDSEWRSIMMFGDGPLKNVAYLRLAPEAPYAGSWHLFVRPTLAPRGRSVR